MDSGWLESSGGAMLFGMIFIGLACIFGFILYQLCKRIDWSICKREKRYKPVNDE